MVVISLCHFITKDLVIQQLILQDLHYLHVYIYQGLISLVIIRMWLSSCEDFFNHRPTHPKYTATWDPSVVLTYLKAQAEQSLKTLTLKLTMLLALHTAQRGQTLHMLDLNFMTITGDSAVFTFETPLKHEKVGKPRFPVKLEAVKDKDICALNILKIYISRTMELRNGETRLLISYNKPHRGVSRDTIRRWIIQTMHKSGVNTVFGAHTTRSATTSAALRNNINLNVILSAAQWSSSRTFQKFYNKPLV